LAQVVCARRIVADGELCRWALLAVVVHLISECQGADVAQAESGGLLEHRVAGADHLCGG